MTTVIFNKHKKKIQKQKTVVCHASIPLVPRFIMFVYCKLWVEHIPWHIVLITIIYALSLVVIKAWLLFTLFMHIYTYPHAALLTLSSRHQCHLSATAVLLPLLFLFDYSYFLLRLDHTEFLALGAWQNYLIVILTQFKVCQIWQNK